MAYFKARVSTSSGNEPVLLWTNPNPTSTFATQTLSIDLSQYECLFVETEGNLYNTGTTSYKQMTYVDLSVDKYSICGRYLYSNGNTYISTRLITGHTNSSISFGGGAAGSTTNDKLCIPLNIYGLKKAII